MAKNLNLWVGNGHLTKDVEVRYTPSGDCVAQFSIAVNDDWADKSGDKISKVEYVRIVTWKKLAEICGEYLSRGSFVLVTGKLKTRSWEKDGITRYTTEIVANNVQFLSPKGESASGHQQQDHMSSGYQHDGQNYGPGSDRYDDDIPF